MKRKKAAEAKSEEESPLETGKDTQTILKHIPEADVKLALHAYHEIRKLEPLKKIPNWPEAELLTVENTLKKLQRNDWMNEDDFERILNDIHEAIHDSKSNINANVKETMRHGKGGNYKDFALDILCFSLTYMLSKLSKLGPSQRSDSVAGFLSEQSIKFSTDYIRKKRSKQNIDSVLWNLLSLGAIHSGDTRGDRDEFAPFMLRLMDNKFVPLAERLLEYHTGKKKSLFDYFLVSSEGTTTIKIRHNSTRNS